MVFSYDGYCQWWNWRWHQNVPPLLAILMAIAVHELPDGACPGLSEKPLDAAIGQLLTLYCPSGCQGNSKQNDNTKNWSTLLAILMAAAVHRYDTARISQWRRSRALVEATERCHWASIAANRCQSYLGFFQVFSSSTCKKGRGSTLRLLFSIGVLHIKQKRRG